MKKIIIIIIALLIILPVGAHFGINYLFRKCLHEFVTELGLENSLKWSKASVNVFKRKATISGITLTQPSRHISVDSIILSGYRYSRPVPKALTADINDMSILLPDRIFGSWNDAMAKAGYSNMAISGSITMNRSADGNMEVTFNNIHMQDTGTVNASISYNDLKGSTLAGFVKNIPSAPIVSLWANFKDDGHIVNNMITLFAADSDTAFDNARTRILTGINRRIQTQFQPNSTERKNLAQIYRYIDSPGSITVQLQDGKTLAIKDLMPDENVKGWRTLVDWITKLPVIISAN